MVKLIPLLLLLLTFSCGPTDSGEKQGQLPAKESALTEVSADQVISGLPESAKSKFEISSGDQLIAPFTLSNAKEITTMIDEDYESICSRENPIVNTICKDVTRNETTCDPDTSEVICNDDYRTVCKDITKYRQECNTVTRRDCHKVPGDPVCRTVSREKCRQVPGRDICRTVPGKEICTESVKQVNCRQVPGKKTCRTNRRTGKETCRTSPSRRVCEKKVVKKCKTGPSKNVCKPGPSRRKCETVYEEKCKPGKHRKVCKDVTDTECKDIPYSEQVCKETNDRTCETIVTPGACETYPVTENVCEDVTTYETEEYACTKTRQIPITFMQQYESEIEVKVLENKLQNSKLGIEVGLLGNGELAIHAQNINQEKAIVFAKKTVQKVATEEENLLKEKIIFEVMIMDEAEFTLPLKNGFSELKAYASAGLIQFALPQISSSQEITTSLSVEVAGQMIEPSLEAMKKATSVMSVMTVDGQIKNRISINLNVLGLNLKQGSTYQLKLKAGLKPKSDLELFGQASSESQIETNVELKL